MGIRREIKGMKRYFDICISKEEAERLLTLDSDNVLRSDYTQCGARFHLYPHPIHFSRAFTPLPPGEGGTDSDYFIEVGDTNLRTVGDLEKMFDEKGNIPLEVPGMGRNGKPMNLGYVRLRVGRSVPQKTH